MFVWNYHTGKYILCVVASSSNLCGWYISLNFNFVFRVKGDYSAATRPRGTVNYINADGCIRWLCVESSLCRFLFLLIFYILDCIWNLSKYNPALYISIRDLKLTFPVLFGVMHSLLTPCIMADFGIIVINYRRPVKLTHCECFMPCLFFFCRYFNYAYSLTVYHWNDSSVLL